MEDPFVTVVDKASYKFFGTAPLHKEPSPSVQLPSSPTSHQLPRKTGQSLNQSKTFRASSSNLSAVAAPFRPKSTSPDSSSLIENPRSISFPLARDEWIEKPPLNKSLKHLQLKDHFDSIRIEKKELDQKATVPIGPRSQRGSDDIYMSGQPSNQFNRVPSADAFLATPKVNEGRSPFARSHRTARSDDSSLYKRSTIQPGKPVHFPACVDWSYSAPPDFRQWWQPLSRENTLPANALLNARASYSMPQLKSQHSNVLDSHQLNFSSHGRPARKRILNPVRQASFQADQNGDSSQANVFDHYVPTPSVPSQSQPNPQTQINPYSQDGSTMGPGTYFPGGTNYPQQVIQFSKSLTVYPLMT